MTKPMVAGLIPARYGSTRLEGKALRLIHGKPMIQWVYERCSACESLDVVAVATDDERIKSAVEEAGGTAIMTRVDHPSGTDRLAEAVQHLECGIVVNIQGDQPFIDAVMIDECVQPLLEEPDLPMCTLMHPVSSPEDLQDPGVVKTVVDLQGNALYFSRSLVPHPHKDIAHLVYEHVGLYAYRKDFLLTLAKLPPTPLEQIESLEQLRVLENGYKLRVVVSHCANHVLSGFSVDTEADLARAEALAREYSLI